jgi:hypothetical protein
MRVRLLSGKILEPPHVLREILPIITIKSNFGYLIFFRRIATQETYTFPEDFEPLGVNLHVD